YFEHLGAAAQGCQSKTDVRSHERNGIAPFVEIRGYPLERLTRVRVPPGLCDEVLGRRVRADDGVGGLFGLELRIVAHGDADPVRPEELDDLRVVGQIGAGRVAPRVA